MLARADSGYVGMATSMVLACLIRYDEGGAWEFHEMDVPVFGEAGGRSALRVVRETCAEWLDARG